MSSSSSNEYSKVTVKALLSAVEEGSDADSSSYEPLNVIFGGKQKLEECKTAKQQLSLIQETLQNFPKKQAKRFFSSLKSLVEGMIEDESYVPQSAFQEEGEEEEEKEEEREVTPDAKSTECLLFLKYAAMCVQYFVEGSIESSKKQVVTILPQVYDVAADLHNILFSLQGCGPQGFDTQAVILKMCQAWWLGNCEYRETLIAQCLPLLTLRACEDTAEFQAVKLLHKLKDAFSCVDFTNPSSDALRSLILKLASNPLVLKIPEGKKFLAALFKDPDLVKDLHLAFRAQIPQAKKSILLSYGEIYYRAWKDMQQQEEDDTHGDGDDELSPLATLEHEALQDLMHASIHVAAPATLKSVFTVLELFFADKKSSETARLLYRLYNPILWRSLAAANPMVRKNAICVLEKIFPLNDPSCANQTKDAIEKAALALKTSLQDKSPQVRIMAASATAKICTVFWDAMPATEIRMLLNQIVVGHASDSSSAAVRVSALEAVTKLLEAPQSHAVLRALLPSMGNLIHDKTEKVRMATVKMLLKIKETRGIRFYHVVPVDHLTARLAEESRLSENPRSPIAKELTALMLNSYFPQGSKVSGADQLKRSLTFFMTDPSAAVVFYANLVDFLEEEAVVKFIAMLLKCLKSAVDVDQASKVKNSKKQKKRRRQQQADKEEEEDSNSLSASNTALMAALADTICVLMESVMPVLDDLDDHPCKEFLLSRFAEIDIINILAHFEQIASENTSQSDENESNRRNDCLKVYAAILRCLAQLPQDIVDGIVEFIASSMTSLAEETRPLTYIMSHLVPLCVWGMTDDIALALSKSMESAYGNEDYFLSPCSLNLTMRSRRSSVTSKRSKSSSVELPSFAPDVAFSVLNGILQGSDCSSMFLRQKILASEKASKCLEKCLEQAIVFAERILEADEGFGSSYFKESYYEYILCLCEAYGRFTLHKASLGGDDGAYTQQAKKLLDWTSSKVVSAFLNARPEDDDLRNLDISRISNVSDSLLLTTSPSTMSPPGKKSDLRRTPTRFGRISTSSEQEDTPLHLEVAFAASLLQSVCVLFAEELAIGAISNGEDIASAAISWCLVFDADTSVDDEDYIQSMLKGLVPGFVRLAMQLCRSSANFQLWKQLLVKFHPSFMSVSEQNLVKKAVTSLLKTQFGEESKLTGDFVDTVVAAMEVLVPSHEVSSSKEEEKESTTEDLWTHHPHGYVGLILQVVLEHKHACRALAKRLSETEHLACTKFLSDVDKKYPNMLEGM